MEDIPLPPPKGVSPRAKMTLDIPPPNFAFNQRIPQTVQSPRAYPNFNNMQPMTPAAVDENSPYFNPFLSLYQSKATDFMFKHLEDFKDFTMNTAKSGLSVGEKSAFWLYAKLSTWSKKWFTHIFLAIVMFFYTCGGAAVFVAIEGTREKALVADLVAQRKELIEKLRVSSKNPALQEDPQLWSGNAINLMLPFEAQLNQAYKSGINSLESRTWGFWNSMFYCGTIFTTIGM